jgi:VanZ family protein
MSSEKAPNSMDRSNAYLTLGARMAFAVALGAVAWLSLTPDTTDPALIPWDKARHFLAFYMLTGLAVIGLPRVNLLWLGLALLAYGGLIEVFQGMVGRQTSLLDLAANGAGIAALFAGMAAQQARTAPQR